MSSTELPGFIDSQAAQVVLVEAIGVRRRPCPASSPQAGSPLN